MVTNRRLSWITQIGYQSQISHVTRVIRGFISMVDKLKMVQNHLFESCYGIQIFIEKIRKRKRDRNETGITQQNYIHINTYVDLQTHTILYNIFYMASKIEFDN